MSKFRPIKVTATLGSEVITDGYCPLDAAIYFHFIRSLYGVQDRSIAMTSNVPQYSYKSLPILKCNTKSDNWFYASSFCQWSTDAVYSKRKKTRRFDTESAMKYVDFGKKRGKVEVSRGSYKNYMIEEYTISSPVAVWYLVADPVDISNYLLFVKHIGKKASGAVVDWDIQPFDHDWSIRGQHDNRLMRTVPVDSERSPIYGLRPSYWHPRHQTKVFLPKVAFTV